MWRSSVLGKANVKIIEKKEGVFEVEAFKNGTMLNLIALMHINENN